MSAGAKQLTSIPDDALHLLPMEHGPATNMLHKDVQSQLRHGSYDFAALQPTIRALNQLAKPGPAAGECCEHLCPFARCTAAASHTDPSANVAQEPLPKYETRQDLHPVHHPGMCC